MENQTLNTVVKTVLFHGYSCTYIKKDSQKRVKAGGQNIQGAKAYQQ